MNTLVQEDLADYRAQLRADVCSRCIERSSHVPQCGDAGGGCGIESHLAELVELCRTTDSARIDPYIDQLHGKICAYCDKQNAPCCPCPLDYLLALAIEAVETVERRRQAGPDA
ncbi:MAG: hypothetical protein U0805_15125 [Pirellulales bacterium]